MLVSNGRYRVITERKATPHWQLWCTGQPSLFYKLRKRQMETCKVCNGEGYVVVNGEDGVEQVECEVCECAGMIEVLVLAF